MLTRLLQGKPIGHPLHTILVHFPIGLFLLSFIFDICGVVCGGAPSPNVFVRPAFYTMALGVLMAVLAAIPGVVDYSAIRRDHPGRRIATYHMILNLTAVVLYIINIALRGNQL